MSQVDNETLNCLILFFLVLFEARVRIEIYFINKQKKDGIYVKVGIFVFFFLMIFFSLIGVLEGHFISRKVCALSGYKTLKSGNGRSRNGMDKRFVMQKQYLKKASKFY